MSQMLFMPGVMLPSGSLIGNSQISSKVNGRLISNKPRQLTPDGKQEMVVEYVPVANQRPIGNVGKRWQEEFEEMRGDGQEQTGGVSNTASQPPASLPQSGILQPSVFQSGVNPYLGAAGAAPVGNAGQANNNQQPLGKPAWDAAYGHQPSQVASQATNTGQQPAPQPVANSTGQQPLGTMESKWDDAFKK